MGELLGLFATAATGGVFGGIAGLLRLGLDWVKRRSEIAHELSVLQERNAHELKMRDKDLEMLRLEGDVKVKVAAAEGDAMVESSRMQAIASSFASDKATFATGAEAANSPWFVAVDFVRGMIRPAITVLFDLALFVIWGVLLYLLWEHLGALLRAKDATIVALLSAQFVEITKAIIFIALSATSYWFVARQKEGKGNG